MPNREDFDADTLHVMDQVATLLLISRKLREMAPTFENSPDLDKSQASPDARDVLIFARETGRDLMDAVFRQSNRRGEYLANVRRKQSSNLDDAIGAALRLAELEREALAGSGAKGDFIEKTVLEPLRGLKRVWKELDLKAESAGANRDRWNR